ncbi:MAG TPA: methyltransferase domain-containing protein [Burkholderiales bacterium]|nr:methyltransferase domain-containing protein [Burkholderiales bacterium]
MSERSPRIDYRTVRRRFERAAATYGKSSKLESEVAARMLERLDYVRIAPRRVLDAGSGPPRRELAGRYPKADVFALDFALPMLRASRPGWFRRRSISLCSDIARLPLTAEAFELVWSNMTLHWLDDPLPAFKEFARVLVPEGLLMFSTLGPDSLKELRAAAGAQRVHEFIDMHDLGDMLVAAGFAAPVMDMDMIQVDFGRSETLLAELRASGQTSARADRRRGLGGRTFRERLRVALPGRATFEVVYGHAWKGRKAHPELKSVRVFKRMP